MGRNANAPAGDPPSISLGKTPVHIALVRFSALGDIAMTIPVIDSLARQYQEATITVVSRPYVKELFSCLPTNVHFVGADLKHTYKGVWGMRKLANDLHERGVTHLADLHDVLRTKFLRHFLAWKGVKVAHIDKGRLERKLLLRHQLNAPMLSPFERYAKVLEGLALPVSVNFQSLNLPLNPIVDEKVGMKADGERWLGIAPFAAHEGKIYPLSHMTKVLQALSSHYPKMRIFVFGTAREIAPIREEWSRLFDSLTFVPDLLKGFEQELQLMLRLNVMISMDSANMHLASLVNLPVVSIWGETHPLAGFMGWNQRLENAVQMDLECRPCSIFGNKPCKWKDYRCMMRLTPHMVTEKVEDLLKMVGEEV